MKFINWIPSIGREDIPLVLEGFSTPRRNVSCAGVVYSSRLPHQAQGFGPHIGGFLVLKLGTGEGGI
jgi:hypothetical protein